MSQESLPPDAQAGAADDVPPGLAQLRSDLLTQYGVMLDHVQLRKVLGYRTTSAFQRAVSLGRVGIRVFNVPGRRGKFALSADVADWLWKARQQAAAASESAPDARGGP